MGRLYPVISYRSKSSFRVDQQKDYRFRGSDLIASSGPIFGPCESHSSCRLSCPAKRILHKTVAPHQDVTTPLDGKGCPYFQVMKYIKTNPKQEKIQNAIPNFPTPFVAFSNDVEVALYFSSCKLDFDGAIYRVVKNSIPTKYSFKESLEVMVKGKRDSPCIIDPMVGLNDVDDPKSKRQEAVYIFQRDLDLPINRYIAMEKIIIKNEFKPLIQQMLIEKGITKEFLLG